MGHKLWPYENYGFSENDGEVDESPYSNNLYETTYQNYEYDNDIYPWYYSKNKVKCYNL